jgi:hypothetical protein
VAQAGKTDEFTDVQFMSAAEKTKVLRQWRVFLDSKFDKAKFTESLYHHLMQHEGYIAHYDRHGFYAEYFRGDFADLQRFFKFFEQGGMIPGGPMPEYRDIHTAMLEVYEERKETIWAGAQGEADRRFEVLKAWVTQAETDTALRLKLLAKVFG